MSENAPPGDGTEAIRVLVADDHKLFLEGLKALLASLEDFIVIGEAASGDEVIAKATTLQPDIILMDIQMPGPSGVEATRRILTESPHIGILMVTMYDDDESVFTAMRAGARGYLLKGADQAELTRAITAVASGEALFSPSIAARLMRFFSAPRPDLPMNAFPDLTGREREVLGLIAKGLGNPQIGRTLKISPKTVRNHVSNIFSKLQVVGRAEAIVKARQAGLGEG